MDSAAVTDPEQQAAPPRFWFPIHERKGRWLMLLVGVLVLLPLLMLAYQILSSRNQPLTISKETTFITEPLTAAGLPDYVAALNARLGAGVTPDTNAVVKLWEALGPYPDRVSREYHAALAEALGIVPLPEHGDYYVDFSEWGAELTLPEEDRRKRIDQFLDEFSRASEAPWKTADYPDLLAWIERNEIPLQRVHEALQRPHYFQPIVLEETASEYSKTLAGVSLPHLFRYRRIAELLLTRAMWHLGEGRVEQAMDDLLDCHRLARKMSQGWMVIDLLIANSIDAYASIGTFVLIVDPQLNRDHIRLFREQLTQLGPVITTEKVTQIIDQGERLMALDLAISLAAGEVSLDGLRPAGYWSVEQPVEWMHFLGVDVNQMLRETNLEFDQLREILSQPDRNKRRADLNRLTDKYSRQVGRLFFDQARFYSFLVLNGGRARGQALATVMLHSILPITLNDLIEYDRGETKWQTQLAGLALVAYRLEHGRYPADLQTLIPDYLPEIPRDIFSGDPLLYRVSDDGREMKIYSVGPNRVDNDGIRYNDPDTNGPQGDDIGVVDPLPQLQAEGEAQETDADSANGEDS